jgi:predicted ArsR family transcriptional regulator
MEDFERQLGSLGALEEPVRQKLYFFVAGHDGDVSRDEAAEAAGVSRALAAFHLDKLVEAGLLEATYKRLSGKAGPGAGRPSKLYRRAAGQIDVSLPRRRYELAAHVLAQAVDDPDRVKTAAREWGIRLAGEVGKRTELPLRRATRALEAAGFEPRRTKEGEVVLRNCPFASLSAGNRELICGMNLALIEGLLEGLAIEGVEAKLAPRAGLCCVTLRRP